MERRILVKPKLGPSTKFEVKCGEAEECRADIEVTIPLLRKSTNGDWQIHSMEVH